MQRRSRDTVAAIVEAAARVFDRLGSARATTNRIAERAGVSIGSLYEYFPNKDAILLALAGRHLDEAAQAFTARLDTIDFREPLDVLTRKIIAPLIELHAEHPGLHRVLLERLMMQTPVRQRIRELEQSIAAQLAERLRGHPEVAVPDLDLACQILVTAVDAVWHEHLQRSDGASDERIAHELAALARRYLGGSA